ncbi:hypothetical protein FB559_5083 [Actinoallomurus bryophytorum]|uniref:Uncharacterized protein n=1 Tax=Actinoallomurus bryophytorum TaxID=1490222 RepID=A0A543CQM3_9ACTN|nr:hypothetical protein FB559_5083 [Actinoallomurus bryophytorum]
MLHRCYVLRNPMVLTMTRAVVLSEGSVTGLNAGAATS